MPVLLLSALLHAYIGWRLLPAWSGHAFVLWPLALLLLASAVLMPLSVRRIRWQRFAQALTWAGLVFMGLFSSLFVLTLIRDLGLGVAALVSMARPLPIADMSRLSGQAVTVVALLVTLWGYVNARRTARVVDVDVPIDGLPEPLHGFTIAQISDIHVGPTIRGDYLSAIVGRVNRLEADLVAVTGDLVDGRVADLAPHVAPLAELRSRHGSFFVTGNHEYYSGADPWTAELRRLGLNVLQNQHVVIRHGDASLVVAGVTDYSAHHFDPSQRSDPAAAIAGAPPDAAVKILLAHQPRSADAAHQAGFDLQLSGHTHGGQFWPWNHFVPLQQPYTAGLHRLRGMWVYTSRGTGYWGPPKRLGAPSEITRIRLVPARR
jgi:uncharacterized protein